MLGAMPHIDRRSLLALLALGLAAAALGARLLGLGASSGPPPDALAPAPAAAEPAAEPAPVASERLVVHVVGAVRRPGVYRLRRGARALDAVRAAGGATRRADLAGLNLAAEVVDGEQVAVPRRGAAPAPNAAGTPAGPAAPPAIVHLNSADAAALETLPGVGPATAARIIAWRAQNGGFEQLDDLLEVPGIGAARIEALRGLAAP